jgi:hypothetical protein
MPPKRKDKPREYAIQPKMVSPDTIKMDMESFNNSEIVKRQVELSKKAIREKETAEET